MEFKHDSFENFYEIGEELGRLVGPISFKQSQVVKSGNGYVERVPYASATT